MIDFTGQTALITGASGSIGSAITKLIHHLGGRVIISGSNAAKLEALSNSLKERCTVKLCDLSDITNCNNLLSDVENLDILVCNAGITQDSLAIKMTDEQFDKVLDINLKASFILNREAIKKMLKIRFGRIINIASVVGVTGNPGQANYCASKAGLIGMTKSLAQEVATKSITINAVAPGFIKSNMTDKLNEAQIGAITQKIPSKILGLPEDVASAVAFLASKHAAYITGQTIHVNGGLVMV